MPSFSLAGQGSVAPTLLSGSSQSSSCLRPGSRVVPSGHLPKQEAVSLSVEARVAYGYMSAMDRRWVSDSFCSTSKKPSPSAGSLVNPSVQLGSQLLGGCDDLNRYGLSSSSRKSAGCTAPDAHELSCSLKLLANELSKHARWLSLARRWASQRRLQPQRLADPHPQQRPQPRKGRSEGCIWRCTRSQVKVSPVRISGLRG